VVFCVPRRAYRYNMAGVERNHVFSWEGSVFDRGSRSSRTRWFF
jgi:hypothetical protein